MPYNPIMTKLAQEQVNNPANTAVYQPNPGAPGYQPNPGAVATPALNVDSSGAIQPPEQPGTGTGVREPSEEDTDEREVEQPMQQARIQIFTNTI